MPQEIALNVPFDAEEIQDIACAELRKTIKNLSPMQGMKQYGAFSLSFEVKIRLVPVGTGQDDKNTLAWGNVERGIMLIPGAVIVDSASVSYQSKDPNDERVDRDMPLTVEAGDGKGGKVLKKIRIKGA